MNLSITDLANLIWYDELDETDQTTIPEVAFWLRNSGIGKLNNLIFTSFDIDSSTLEITPASSFGLEEAIILVQLYLVKYYSLQVTKFLGAVGVNDVIEYNENGMVIRKLNKNEMAKTWIQLRDKTKEDLKDLITGYKISKSTAKSIEGQELNLLSTMLPRYNRVLNQGL